MEFGRIWIEGVMGVVEEMVGDCFVLFLGSYKFFRKRFLWRLICFRERLLYITWEFLD